jgi:type I restriction enzyme, R subunit
VEDGRYHGPEEQERLEIDRQLDAAGWVVQPRDDLDVTAGLGVAVRDRRGVNDPDYLLFVDGRACGVVE